MKLKKNIFEEAANSKNIEDFGEMVRDSIISVFEDRYHRVIEKGLVIEFDLTNSNLLGLVNYEDTPLVRKFAKVWNFWEKPQEM